VTLLATIPELDPYHAFRQPQAHFLGKIRYTGARCRLQWRSQSQPRIFLYLNVHGPYRHVLDILSACPVETIAVVPDMSDDVARHYAEHTHLRVHPAFVDVGTILTGCDLLVAHGGQGITLDSLCHGVPLLLLPCHVEQLLTTACIARANAGLGILPDYIEHRFLDVVTALLTDGQYRDGARALQQKYWGDPAYCALEAALVHITGATGIAVKALDRGLCDRRGRLE
jgi:UDP:flavonoid glycosyltransferase YjiC (YdhE family)